MFTGIIHHRARVVSVSPTSAGVRLSLASPFAVGDAPQLGDSIAVDGCCLTVAANEGGLLAFDVIPETLGKTTLGLLARGAEVHAERSLRVGDRVDGHFVQGHVDGVGEVLQVVTLGEWRATIRVPVDLGKYLVPKGSISVAGVSLTLARVSQPGAECPEFDITLIPTTLQLTTLGRLAAGSKVNIECDATVKTIVATLERMGVETGARV